MRAAALARRRRNGCYGYLSLPGTTGNYASTPDSASLSISGNIDIRVKVALTDWTPATACCLVGKYLTTGNQRAYRLDIDTLGRPNLYTSPDGTNAIQALCANATGVTDGAAKWVRAIRTSSTGVAKFYLSDDGSTWSQLATDVSTTAGGIADTTALLETGSFNAGANEYASGKFYHVQVRSNVLNDGSGIVFDADFTNTGRTFTEPALGAVVTVNGTTARASVYP